MCDIYIGRKDGCFTAALVRPNRGPVSFDNRSLTAALKETFLAAYNEGEKEVTLVGPVYSEDHEIAEAAFQYANTLGLRISRTTVSQAEGESNMFSVCQRLFSDSKRIHEAAEAARVLQQKGERKPALENFHEVPLEKRISFISELPAADRDLVSGCVKFVSRGLLVKNSVDVPPSRTAADRSVVAGYTGAEAELNRLLSDLGADAITRRYYTKRNTANAFIGTVEEAIAELQRFKTGLDEIAPIGEPEVLRLLEDSDWREHFKASFPKKGAAKKALKRLLKSKAKKAKEGRQYSRFHFIPFWHEGFCPVCDSDLSSVPAGEPVCPRCLCDIDPGFYMRNWSQNYAFATEQIRRLEAGVQAVCSRIGRLESRITPIICKLQSKMNGNPHPVFQARIERLRGALRKYDAELEVFQRPASCLTLLRQSLNFEKDFVANKLDVLSFHLMDLSAEQKGFAERVDAIRIRIDRMDPGGENPHLQAHLRRLSEIEQRGQETFTGQWKSLYERIRFWESLSGLQARLSEISQSETKRSEGTKALLPLANGTREGGEKLFAAAKDGQPAYYRVLFNIQAEKKLSAWIKQHFFRFDPTHKNEHLQALCKFWTGVKYEDRNRTYSETALRIARGILREPKSRDTISGKKHVDALNICLWALGGPTIAPSVNGELAIPNNLLAKIYHEAGGKQHGQFFEAVTLSGEDRLMLRRLMNNRDRLISALAGNGMVI